MREDVKKNEIYKVFLRYMEYSAFRENTLKQTVRTEEFRVNNQQDALKFAQSAENFHNVVSVTVLRMTTYTRKEVEVETLYVG